MEDVLPKSLAFLTACEADPARLQGAPGVIEAMASEIAMLRSVVTSARYRLSRFSGADPKELRMIARDAHSILKRAPTFEE